MLIEREDPFTGVKNTMELPITEEQMRRYDEGALIQVAFPNLTPSQREFIQTGLTEEAWDDLFKNQER